MPVRRIDVQDEGAEPVYLYVGVYAVGRNYGGPEEGGWWYDSGELIEAWLADTEIEAEAMRDDLREGQYRKTGKRYSVLGGDDYDVVLCAGPPPQFFPEERPRYE